MSRARRIATGSLATVAVVAATAILSSAPRWHRLPPDTGVLTLAFTHGGARSCRALAEAELAKLPENMRRTTVCDRARADVRLELDIDGTPALRAVLRPAGFAGDGPARVYERFPLAAGPHQVDVRMADSGREQGFDHTASRQVALAPAKNLVIDFRPEEGGFVFR